MIMNIIYMSLEVPSMHSLAHFHVKSSELTTWFMINPFLRSFYSRLKLKILAYQQNKKYNNRSKWLSDFVEATNHSFCKITTKRSMKIAYHLKGDSEIH